LETIRPDYEIPDMYVKEDSAFIESIETGIKNRSHIDNILNSMLLLDSLYRSNDEGKEVALD